MLRYRTGAEHARHCTGTFNVETGGSDSTAWCTRSSACSWTATAPTRIEAGYAFRHGMVIDEKVRAFHPVLRSA